MTAATQDPRPRRDLATTRRPRSERAILDATYQLLHEQGLGAVTVEAIARNSGVSKVTIYKWWPNRAAVIMSAFLDAAADALPYPEEVSHAALERRLLQMASEFQGPMGKMIAAIIAEGQTDEDVSTAFREGYIVARRQTGIALVKDAMRQGLIRRADPDIVLDLMYAPLYFRLLIGHQPLSEDFVRQHVDLLLSGLQPT